MTAVNGTEYNFWNKAYQTSRLSVRHIIPITIYNYCYCHTDQYLNLPSLLSYNSPIAFRIKAILIVHTVHYLSNYNGYRYKLSEHSTGLD